MPGKDRLETLIEQVAALAGAVATLTEHQIAQDQRHADGLEAMAKGLEGIGKLGSKVGALATAMDRNMEQVTATREAFVRKQREVAEQVRVMTRGEGRTTGKG
jgi:methyl-accepting chemotaxis protein